VAGEVFGKDVQRLARRFVPLRLLLQGIEALLLLLFLGVAAVLPPASASRLGATLFGCIGPRLGKSRHVRNNLRVVLDSISSDPGACDPGPLPGSDQQRKSEGVRQSQETLGESRERQLARLERGCWATLGAVLAEMPHLHRIGDLARQPPAVELALAPGAEDLLERLKGGEAFIFVTAHLANWELLPRLLVQAGGRVAVIFTAQGNSFTDGLLQWLRRSEGVSYVGKRGGIRELLRAARAGQSLGLLVDLRSDEGEPISFFGRPAMTTTAPARLSLMGEIPMIPVRTERLGPARFRVTVEAPIRPRQPKASAQARARDMTEQLNDRFAEWIRARPQDWLCTKRRFPKERPPSGHGKA